MSTEISHIDVRSAFRVALPLGGINGVFLSVPIIWHWIQTMEWVTGVEIGAGMFAIGVLLSIATTAISTAIVVAVFVVAYNVVAARAGGIEVRFST